MYQSAASTPACTRRAPLITTLITVEMRRHVVVWLTSLLFTVGWQRQFAGARSVDTICACAAHLVALPVILFCVQTPKLLPLIGCSMLGCCLGICVVDVVFDMQVLDADESLDGFSPKRMAWGYYHSVLNSSLINGIMLFFLLLMAFGAWIGIEDALITASKEVRRLWVMLVILCSAGVPLYLCLVVPRYMSIRFATAYDPQALQRWFEVLAARIVLMVSMAAGCALCMRLSLQQRHHTPHQQRHPQEENVSAEDQERRSSSRGRGRCSLRDESTGGRSRRKRAS